MRKQPPFGVLLDPSFDGGSVFELYRQLRGEAKVSLNEGQPAAAPTVEVYGLCMQIPERREEPRKPKRMVAFDTETIPTKSPDLPLMKRNDELLTIVLFSDEPAPWMPTPEELAANDRILNQLFEAGAL
jgi:hypothetical protein